MTTSGSASRSFSSRTLTSWLRKAAVTAAKDGAVLEAWKIAPQVGGERLMIVG
jgi:hypothetical protein